MQDAPRQHHYTFAHAVLSHLAWKDPPGTLQMLGSKQGERRLKDLWNAIGNDSPEVLPAAGLALSVGRIGEKRIAAIVTLPEPERPLEAWFVALIADVSEEGGDAFRLDNFHYFLLERGPLKDGLPTTVVSAWRPNERGELAHFTFGPGPAPDAEEFVAAVQDLLR